MSNGDNWEWVPHESEDRPKTYKDSAWFKNAKTNPPIKEDKDIAVYPDKFPCCDGHLLFIPKSNQSRWLGMCMSEAHEHGLEEVEKGNCDGFNIGLNIGECAGQSVFWPHVHYIPRINGDQEPGAKGIRMVYPSDPFNPRNKE
jgi:diadenosine tetraphosphate (Ap4A) HIT family hydrolase